MNLNLLAHVISLGERAATIDCDTSLDHVDNAKNDTIESSDEAGI